MYNEDVVAVWASPYGSGSAYDEIVNAIEHRGVDKVGIFGYSHGGGATYALSHRLNQNVLGNLTDITTPFTVPLTGYIDAITSTTAGAENRRPLLSQFHCSQYQQNTGATGGWLNGGPSNGDDDIDRSGLSDPQGNDIVHTTIDDHLTVLELLLSRIRQRITPR